jgi:hypothetical protein
MAWFNRGGSRLARALEGLKKEFLRDPDVVLFERRPEPDGSSSREAAGAR